MTTGPGLVRTCRRSLSPAGAFVLRPGLVVRSGRTPHYLLGVDIPRRKPEDDPDIKARQNTAGKTGFILGCFAAVAALAINLVRTERPYDVLSLLIAVLMAALNIPFGIMLALLAEKWTRRRPRTGKGK